MSVIMELALVYALPVTLTITAVEKKLNENLNLEYRKTENKKSINS